MHLTHSQWLATVNISSEAAKRAALQFVYTSNMPSEHKVVLLEVLRESLENDRTAAAIAPVERAWIEAEEAEMRALLANRPARGWQDADELAMALAVRLRRSPDEIRRKAVAMGLGVSVDYALARWAARQNQP
jgi:hypothetical protein